MGIVRTRSIVYIIIFLALLACLLAGPAHARTEARYELRTGGVVFGNDLFSSRSTQSIFHQQTLNVSDVEKLNIDFPAFFSTPGEKAVSGPTTVGTPNFDATANVLPFGLVNLAFPSISETSAQTYSATSTGFYTSNFLGIPPPNPAAYPVTTGATAFSSPVRAPTSLTSTMPFSEMLNIMPGYDRQKAITKNNADLTRSLTSDQSAAAAGNATSNATASDTTEIKVNRSLFNMPFNGTVVRAQQAGQGTSQTISGQEIAGAETAVPMNYTGTYTPADRLSYPYFMFNANANAVSNMSMLDRMWRNSHLGTMGRAYEGDTSYPTWILPTEFTKSAISMYNWYDVNNMALAYTQPGMHIEPKFWDLGLNTYYAPLNPATGSTPAAAATTPAATPTTTPVSGGNKTTTGIQSSGSPLSTSTLDWIMSNMTSIKALVNTSATGNATGNATGGAKTSAIKAPEYTKFPKPFYLPSGGPAGTGIADWPWKGPNQVAWLGGSNNPWILGPSTNPVYPGQGGPDWPPYYWGFGRYKGW